MYLVVGLGNPGRQYEATRHNMGFDTIDYLVEEYKVPQGGVKFNASVWFASGIHHHYGCEKFVPGFSEESFYEMVGAVADEYLPLSNHR